MKGEMFMSDGMSIDGMLDMYLFENGQLLEQLEQTTLDKKDNECFDEADINDFFRIMHTIKGSSGVMMYDDIMKLSHKLEDVFYFIRESHPEHVPHLELVDCILMVSDFISNEFEKIKSGKEPNGDATELIDKIEQFLVKIKGNNTGKSNVKLLDKREEQPKQFYIGPASAKKGNCFSVVIYYRNDTLMCNIRAYTAVHTLKEKAKEATLKLLESKKELEIVNEDLIPALDIVGEKYEKGIIKIAGDNNKDGNDK